MADFLIEGLDDDLYRLLEARAEAMGVSVEEAARRILVEYSMREAPANGDTALTGRRQGAIPKHIAPQSEMADYAPLIRPTVQVHKD